MCVTCASRQPEQHPSEQVNGRDSSSNDHAQAAMTTTSTNAVHAPVHAPVPPPHRAAALAVLTEPALWRTITSSVGGWPFPLYRFWKEHVSTYTLHTPFRDWLPREFPHRRGAVPQVAVIEDNLAMLQLAYAECKRIETTASTTATTDESPSLAHSLLDMRYVMLCAARFSRFEIIEWLVETRTKDGDAVPWASESDAMTNAFNRRDFQVMDLLYERWPRAQTAIPYRDIKEAVWNDDVELVKWAYDRGYDLSEQGNWRMKHVMDHAASLAMLEMLHSGTRTDVQCSWRAMEKAGSLGDLGMMQFLHARQLGEYNDRAVEYAAARGRLDIVKFFLEDVGLPYTSIGYMNIAATHGHLDIVTYLHERGSAGWKTAAMDGAATNGHLHVVEFLQEHRTEGCTTAAMDGAATNGHFSIVKFLQEHRTEGCTTAAMDGAAANGHCAIVEFLHEHRTEGCTKNAMDQAAANGHLAVVQFLHEHRSEGCTTAAVHAAAMNDHVDVALFLAKHRSEGGTPLTVDTAARRGWCDVVEHLLASRRGKKGGCTKAAMDSAASAGHVDVVALLHERSTVGCTSKAMDSAAAHGHFAVVKFLHDNRAEGCSFRALMNAAANNHLDVVQFLLANRTEGCVSDALEAAITAGHDDVAACLQSALRANDATNNSNDDDRGSDSDNGDAFSALWQ